LGGWEGVEGVIKSGVNERRKLDGRKKSKTNKKHKKSLHLKFL